MQQIATNFKNRLTKRKVKAAEKRQVCHAKLHIMVVLPNMAGAPREARQGRRGHRSRTQEDRQEEVCTGGARPEEEGEGRCAEQRRQRRRRRRLSVGRMAGVRPCRYAPAVTPRPVPLRAGPCRYATARRAAPREVERRPATHASARHGAPRPHRYDVLDVLPVPAPSGKKLPPAPAGSVGPTFLSEAVFKARQIGLID